MFVYEKQLQYPVKIKNPNPALAKLIITQYGGPDGELGASLRYLSQRFAMPLPELKATLTDIGTEVLNRVIIVCIIFISPKDIRQSFSVGILHFILSGLLFSYLYDIITKTT